MLQTRRKTTLIIAMVIGLGGCSTAYQPKGLSGGYEDQALGNDRYHISVKANAYAGVGTVEEYFYRRAQDIVKEQGYDGYRVVELHVGVEPGILSRSRPIAFGIIQGYKGAAPPGVGGGAAEQSKGARSAGTGFVVSPDGVIVTNHHVVPDCRKIEIRQLDGTTVAVSLLASDPNNDLALLKSPLGTNFARFRDGAEIRPGDGAVAVGFPLPGTLSSGMTLTTGTVSALAGPADDSRMLQLSTPIQHGNSGGPVLDQSGNVIGIVKSKFNILPGGDIPQNVNFAIKAPIARTFMDVNRVGYQRAASQDAVSNAEIGERARLFIVQVICTQ
jgi:S1-C subfamily serine protease